MIPKSGKSSGISGALKKLPVPIKIGAGVLLALFIKKLVNRTPKVGRAGGVRPTLTKVEAGIIAEAQYAGMEGLDFGAQEQLVEMLEPLNGTDLRYVYDKFGRRPYGIAGYLPVFLGGSEKDIFGWYHEELSGTVLDDMRATWVKSDLPITF